MHWEEFVHNALSNLTEGEKIRIDFEGKFSRIKLPPSVNASIAIIEELLSENQKLILMTLPETKYMPSFTVIWKMLSDVLQSRLGGQYDPAQFKKGQRLKLGSAVVEFESIDFIDGKKRISIRLAENLTERIPLSLAPFFQLTDSGKKLSKSARFWEEFNKINKLFDLSDTLQNTAKRLSNLKTHNRKYFLIITQKNKYTNLFDDLNLENHPFNDLVLFGSANQDGEIVIRESGQYQGVPTLVLAYDLYEAAVTIRKNPGLEAIFVDPTRIKTLLMQLEKLDEFREQGYKIIVFSDGNIFFNDESIPLLNRATAIWDWSSETIIPSIINNSFLPIDQRLKNMKAKMIFWESLDDNGLSYCVELLNKIKEDVKQLGNEAVLNNHEALLKTALELLNQMYPLSIQEIDIKKDQISKSAADLKYQKQFLDEGLLAQLNEIMERLYGLLNSNITFVKGQRVADYFIKNHQARFCVVLSSHIDLERCREFWKSFNIDSKIHIHADFLTISEFLNTNYLSYDITILSGWFGRDRMKELLYSNLSPEYRVLLFPVENKWKDSSTRHWCKSKNIYQSKMFNRKLNVSTLQVIQEEASPVNGTSDTEEFDDLLLFLNERRFSKYSGKKSDIPDEQIEAVPFTFTGDFFAFLTDSHNSISVTDMILGKSQEIEQISTEKLKTGDFIAIRDSEQDIIRELADRILEKSGKSEYRKLSALWKEALKFEYALIGFDAVCKNLEEAGCKKDKATIRNWIFRDETILPAKIEDLTSISKVTGDETLIEKIDQVYAAGLEVRRAHIMAGTQMSKMLIQKLADYVHAKGNIDPYNISDAINLNIEGIGLVRILKIIDIGSSIKVRTTEINRLIREY